jgi:serine protease Do
MHSNIQIRRSTAILSAIILVMGAALAVNWASNAHRLPDFATTAHAAGGAALPASGTFAPVVKEALPAVVNVSSSKVIHRQRMPQGFFDNPMLRDFFGNIPPQMQQQPQAERMESLGSGVIVSPDGYILTNNHVIDGATDVKVSFRDGKEVPAKVIGADAPTDIAVLKIDRTGLPALPIGDSSKSEVGDIVLAIGNPFGLGGTVSMGIISAKGRSGLGIENYEDFIQTDAAINHGNSGGALVNTQGQLIGINTAILGGDGGGNVGIGFAIPSNLAKNIMSQLIEHGKVTRGYIGVYLGEITPNMRQAFGMSPDQGGVAITQVEPDSPGAKAGLKVEDVIVAMNGEKIEDMQAFRLKVASLPPGTTINLKVLRNGSTVDVPVTLGLNKVAAATGGPGGGQGQGAPSGLEGVQVQTLTPDIVQQLGLRGDVKGVIVTNVDAASAAAEAGLAPNDIIERVNRTPVTNTQEFENAVRQSNNPGGTLLLIRRGDARAFVVVPRK